MKVEILLNLTSDKLVMESKELFVNGIFTCTDILCEVIKQCIIEYFLRYIRVNRIGVTVNANSLRNENDAVKMWPMAF